MAKGTVPNRAKNVYMLKKRREQSEYQMTFKCNTSIVDVQCLCFFADIFGKNMKND